MSRPGDEHIVARNVQREEINILRKLAHQVGFIYKIIQRCTSTKHKIWYKSYSEIFKILQHFHKLIRYLYVMICPAFCWLDKHIYLVFLTFPSRPSSSSATNKTFAYFFQTDVDMSHSLSVPHDLTGPSKSHIVKQSFFLFFFLFVYN